MKKETICVQGGYHPKSGDPRVAPIIQSTTYYYESASSLADLFDLKADGYFYSRLANPTCSVLEEKVALLEHGIGAVACSSGQSANTLAILNVCQAGDNIICSTSVYGGTYNLFDVTLRKLGIETRFVSPDADVATIESLVDEKTKLIFGETIANPSIIVLDFAKFAQVAKKYQLLFFVDNTLATPALINPADLGVNVIVHSSSKYLDGHAVALGGIIVDAGNFVFKGNKRYEEFNEPDESYHGLVYADTPAPFICKLRTQMIRDIGAIMAPENAFLTNLGTETLALRMERHSSNALKIAQFLEKQPQIEWVKYAGLESSKYHDLAQKYLPNGCGGMLSFGVRGGREKAAAFMENLKIIAIVTHVADVRSCVLHPASTTHRQMSDEALVQCGVADNLIRLSVGIENVDDLIDDITQALSKL